MMEVNELIGKTYKEVVEQIRSTGTRYRTVSVDGRAYAITDDLVDDRINLVVNNNTITEAYYG